jgi:hypothetical protein
MDPKKASALVVAQFVYGTKYATKMMRAEEWPKRQP